MAGMCEESPSTFLCPETLYLYPSRGSWASYPILFFGQPHAFPMLICMCFSWHRESSSTLETSKPTYFPLKLLLSHFSIKKPKGTSCQLFLPAGNTHVTSCRISQNIKGYLTIGNKFWTNFYSCMLRAFQGRLWIFWTPRWLPRQKGKKRRTRLAQAQSRGVGHQDDWQHISSRERWQSWLWCHILGEPEFDPVSSKRDSKNLFA